MSRQTIQIAEFPQDGKIWRIDWLGSVQRNDNVQSEPTIEVYLRPVDSHQFSNFSPNIWWRTCCYIGVGQLPILIIGSLWKNGQLLSTCMLTSEKLSAISIHPHTIKLINGSSKENDVYIIDKSIFEIGSRKYGLMANMLAIEHNGDPYGILIPVAEVIRFYYAVSTDLSLIIFSGMLENDFNRIIGEYHHFIPEDNYFVIQLRQWLAYNDGYILARVLQSNYANQGFRQVYRSLTQQLVEGIARPMPETNFPFEGKTDWEARYLRFTSNNKPRVLILELLSCSAPFPFDKLEVIRDDGRKANPETDIPDSEKEPYIREQILKNRENNLAFQSQSEPSKKIATQIICQSMDRFPDLKDKEIIKRQKEQYSHISVSSHPFVTQDVSNLGTGMGTYGQSTAAPASIILEAENPKRKEINREKALPASFETMRAAIAYLAENYQDKNVKAKVLDIPDIYIPLTSGRSRQWSYLDSKKQIERRVLIAQIEIQQDFFWLIEFEMRENEFLTAAIIYKLDSISAATMKKILFMLAQRKGIWKNISTNGKFHIRPMKHSWPSIEEYALSIYKICSTISS